MQAASMIIGRCYWCRHLWGDPAELPHRTAHDISPILTIDQGRPDPPPYEGSGFDYASNRDRAPHVTERVPNADSAAP